MEDNDAHVVPAIEKSDLDQALSVNALGRDEVHLSVRWLLDVPHLVRPLDPSSSGLDRARVVSPRRVLFSSFWQFSPNVYSFV